MSRIPGLFNPSKVAIRGATEKDIGSIHAIALVSGIDTWTSAQYREELENLNSLFLVAIRSDLTLGFLLGRVIPGGTGEYDGEIYNIAILADFLRKGIGNALLNRAVDTFKRRKCDAVWLEVRASNSAAIQFYKMNGFIPAAVRKNFYARPTEDAIVMCLTLDPPNPSPAD